MSGTDFTQTPNLALYKPTYDADAEQWGNHLNANADTLDARFGTGGTNGPWLPLAGGTVTGPLTVNAEIDATTFSNYPQRTQTGGTLNTALGLYGALSGTWTGGNSQFARINLLSDTLAAGGGGLTTLQVQQSSGGVGTTGNRIGIFVDFNFAGGTTNKGLGIGAQYGGLWCYAKASGNVGGTSGAGNPYGELWGGISSASLLSGATYWSSCIGHEIDVGVKSGANATYVQGLKIVLANHDQATQTWDYLLGMAKLVLSDVGLGVGIAFGSPDGYWPIASTGTLIGALASNLPTPPPRTAANGVDLSAVTFSGSAFKSSGFSVSGAGAGLLTSLNVSSPSGDDPLTVTTTAANYARVRYVGSRQWTAGVFPDGSYNLVDETGANTRLTITTAGTATIGGTLSVTGAATFNGSALCSNSTLPLQIGGNNNGVLPVGASTFGAGMTFNYSSTDLGFWNLYWAASQSFTWNQQTSAAARTELGRWSTTVLQVNTALRANGQSGFNGTAPIAKPTVTGAKGSNAALASLMTALAAYGLVTDSTTA